MQVTYIGGPTALFELGGLRLLTDPTFDPAGSEYATALYTLRKTQDPAIPADELGDIDVVLLSHDHHFDNLDRSGRELLARVPVVVTTRAGAARLGSPAVGLEPWETLDVSTHDGRTLRITATPARHGPEGGDRGPVIGFVLSLSDEPRENTYISGDTVWYDGVAAVARRFQITAALLFMGAACVREVGPAHLTFVADDAVAVANAFPDAVLVPLHYEGWQHFTEGRTEIERAFASARLANRVMWLERGRPTNIVLPRGEATRV
jgi:L-ascorbate metabolism protein UlaG (beta-lactamase superfamily)